MGNIAAGRVLLAGVTALVVAAAVLGAAALLGVLAPAPLPAAEPVNAPGTAGVAIHGYDPVAYFTTGEPTKGSTEHSYTWRGATWLFASAEHRATFAREPERYAPRYGGFCAYAVSRGYTADIDPAAWTIVDERLYLNLSRNVQRIWERDIPGNIARADANWPQAAQ